MNRKEQNQRIGIECQNFEHWVNALPLSMWKFSDLKKAVKKADYFESTDWHIGDEARSKLVEVAEKFDVVLPSGEHHSRYAHLLLNSSLSPYPSGTFNIK